MTFVNYISVTLTVLCRNVTVRHGTVTLTVPHGTVTLLLKHSECGKVTLPALKLVRKMLAKKIYYCYYLDVIHGLVNVNVNPAGLMLTVRESAHC